MSKLMDTQLHLYLPQLNETTFKSPSKKALWSADNGNEILIKISDSISISESDHKHDINSIPDIWARPLLFASSLISAESPSHKRILNEWRGLLSLIALQKISHININFECLKVSNIDGYNDLKTALVNLKPSPIDWGKPYDWDSVILIKLDDDVIGAFSPSTLVYTGTAIKEVLKRHNRIKQDSDGFLCPPDSADDRQQLEALFYWIDNVKKKISNDASGHKATEILKLFDQWQGDIVKTLGEDRKELQKSVEEKFTCNTKPTLDTNVASVVKEFPAYNVVLQNVEKLKTEGLSDLDLRPVLQFDKTVYVITETLLSEKKGDWGQLEVLKSIESMTPKQMLENYFNKPWGTSVDKINLDLENAIWIRPDLYFLTNKLVSSLNGKDLLCDENGSLSKKYLIPFQNNILKFFSAQHIVDNLSPYLSEDADVITFSFNLPVGNQVCKIDKTYDLSIAEQSCKINVPVLELFPRYLGPSWKRYYLIYNESATFNITPISSLAPVDTVKSYELDKELMHGNATHNVRITHFYADADSQYSPYPDVLDFSDQTGKNIGMVFNIESLSAENSAQKECIIGIDFGTTNTNIYMNMIGEEKGKKKLAIDIPWYYKQITNSDCDLRDHLLDQLFIPNKTIKMPVPSTVRIFNLGQREHVLADYFLYKLSGERVPDNVFSDIKWTEMDKQRNFFNSLLFLVFMEAHNPRDQYTVKSIEFRFSYPKVFNKSEKTSFSSNWKEAIEYMYQYLLGEKTNLSLVQTAYDKRNKKLIFSSKEEKKVSEDFPYLLISEGESSGLFASKNNISMTDCPIIIDIGGGTTDISIWDDYDVPFDCSVKLAGRQLARLFMVNKVVREKLFSEQAANYLNEYQTNEERFNVYLNYFLTKEETEIMNRLNLHNANPDIQWLKVMIMFEFCALIYYSSQGYYNAKGEEYINDNIMLFWGGNAARFITWLEDGKFQEDGIANNMFYWVLSNSLYFLDKENNPDNPFKLRKTTTKPSPDFKSEASGGIVITENSQITSYLNAKQKRESRAKESSMNEAQFEEIENVTTEIENKFIPGDVMLLKVATNSFPDKRVGSYKFVSDKDLFTSKGSNVAVVTLEKLKNFIALFNKAGVNCGFLKQSDQLLLEPALEQDIKTTIQNYMLELAYLEPEDRVLEPIFIMEINKYLELLLKTR